MNPGLKVDNGEISGLESASLQPTGSSAMGQ